MILSLFIPGDPVPFARAGSNGVRRFTPKKQADYQKFVAHHAAQAMRRAGFKQPFSVPLRIQFVGAYGVPKSWSKKAIINAKWKTSRPDIDNMVKGCMDAMTGIIYEDDAQVCELFVRKTYSPIPGMTIVVSALENTLDQND